MSDTPLLSVVIPVFQVRAYLADCLESVLAGTGEEVEIIAVDDHSPDMCGAILDAYASWDPRVLVVHLAPNVGLGRARNTGLLHARGRYVWFVDSDDWLPAGAVAAICQRLVDTRPDVLIIDHVEIHPGGRVRHEPWSAGLDPTAPPGPLRARPALLRMPLATSACTKVVGRDLLDRTGLRFPPGWYEDVAYAFPLLLAAGRIDVLDRVCYCYRRRKAGAITTSVSRRHFDVFAQYDRMWARVALAGGLLRREMFRAMVCHLLVVAGNADRVPARQRRGFFHEAAAMCRRWQPDDGYAVPGGADGLKHRLVQRDAYAAYATLRLLRQLRAPIRRSPPAPVADAALAPPAYRRSVVAR